jgi:Zn-finger protein
MSLKCDCKYCGLTTIPKRIQGIYVGSTETIKLWECRECFFVWSEKNPLGMPV